LEVRRVFFRSRARERPGVGGEYLGHAPRVRAVTPRSETGASQLFTRSCRQSRGQVGTRLRSPKACSTRRTGGQYFDWIRIWALSCTESSSSAVQLPG